MKAAWATAIVLVLAAGASAAADPPDAAVEVVSVRVGFAGHYKAGLWTPVEVTLRGGREPVRAQLVLTVPDGDGVPCQILTPAKGSLEIPAGAAMPVKTCVRFGRVRSDLAVEVRSADRTLARRVFRSGDGADGASLPPALPCGNELVVVAGMPAAIVQDAVSLVEQRPEEKTVVAALDDLGQLPDRWFGYETIDALVLGTRDPEPYASLEARDSRLAALEEWVHMGGRLVFSVGERGEEILAPGAALARFAPGRLDSMVTLRQTAAIESYCGSSVGISTASGARVEVQVPLLAEVDGHVAAREANLPLVVLRARGFGQTVFTAFDLDNPLLAGWQDHGILVGKVLDLPVTEIGQSQENRAVMHYGFTDIAGQLRSALDQFRGVRLAPFWLVVAIVLVYILAIGPGDYLFLRRIVRRLQWTWVSFPAIVLAAVVGVYLLSGWLKGDKVLVNQADVVDVDVASGRIRGTSWANLFSPTSDRYNLSFQARPWGRSAPADVSMLTSWLGLPGEALGGMDSKTTDSIAWDRPYRFSPGLDGLQGVPIQIRSTKSLTTRWTTRTDRLPRADLRDEDRLPVGSITNTLDVSLNECLLAYGNWAYELGAIAPGQTVEVGPMLRRRELRSMLTGRRMYFESADKIHEEVTPYDQGSIDLAYVLRAMMFFQMSGGSRYTGLMNRYQEFVDLSDLLRTDRAILVAEAVSAQGQPRYGARLLRDGEPLDDPGNRHKAVIRFLLPVTPQR